MEMSNELAIMSAIVRVDMFLITAWKYALIILAIMAVVGIMMIRKKQ